MAYATASRGTAIVVAEIDGATRTSEQWGISGIYCPEGDAAHASTN
jgi:hypothetical protein